MVQLCSRGNICRKSKIHLATSEREKTSGEKKNSFSQKKSYVRIKRAFLSYSFLDQCAFPSSARCNAQRKRVSRLFVTYAEKVDVSVLQFIVSAKAPRSAKIWSAPPRTFVAAARIAHTFARRLTMKIQVRAIVKASVVSNFRKPV